MKILKRNEFLELIPPVLFIKCDKFGNAQGELSIMVDKSGSNDFVVCYLHTFIKEWNSTASVDECDSTIKKALENKDNHFEWDYSMTTRDGLYENSQLFMVYEQLDLLKLMRELNRVYLYSYNKDDYSTYWI